MKASQRVRYLEPSWEAGRALTQRRIEGRVVMLNLLRFRVVAGYRAGLGHRAAALEDARLLPLTDLALPH